MGLLSICQKTKKIGQGVSSELTIHAYALNKLRDYDENPILVSNSTFAFQKLSKNVKY